MVRGVTNEEVLCRADVHLYCIAVLRRFWRKKYYELVRVMDSAKAFCRFVSNRRRETSSSFSWQKYR